MSINLKNNLPLFSNLGQNTLNKSKSVAKETADAMPTVAKGSTVKYGAKCNFPKVQAATVQTEMQTDTLDIPIKTSGGRLFGFFRKLLSFAMNPIQFLITTLISFIGDKISENI